MAVSSGRLVEGLRRRDITTDVVALAGGDDESEPQPQVRDRGTDYLVSTSGKSGRTGQMVWNAVVPEHRRCPYTFVVGFGASAAGFLAVTLAAWLGIPSLVMVRGNDLDQDWFDAERGPWVRDSLSRASVVAAVSPDMVRRILALYPGRDVRFLPNGVDPSQWELLPRDVTLCRQIREHSALTGKRVVGLFGELKYKKGVAMWLAAVRDAGLKDKLGLLVVGDRIEEQAARMLEDPALSPSLVRIAFAERERLPGLYAACDYVALPSLIDGMPNALLEAMSVGVVPIVSDAGAMKGVVKDGETGFVFPAGDRDAAGKGTARAMSLPDSELAAMKKRAREHVAANFSAAREIEGLCGIVVPRRM